MCDGMYRSGMKIMDKKIIFITERGMRAMVRDALKEEEEMMMQMLTLYIYLIVARHPYRRRSTSVMK